MFIKEGFLKLNKLNDVLVFRIKIDGVGSGTEG